MRRRERGSAFVLALAVIAGLLAVLASLVASQRVAMKAQINRTEARRARLAAMNGIQRAVATLAAIPQPGQTTTATSGTPQSSTSASGATTLQDDWATLGQNGAENFRVGNSTFRLQIIDSCSRLNINAATEDQLNKLPLTQDQIAAWLDFRTSNRDPRALGAKDEYYNNLPEGYNTKLANFETVDELLQVKGFTPKILYTVITDVQSSNPLPTDANGNDVPLYEILTAYSYSPQLNPQGQTKLNVNQANANQIQQALTTMSAQGRNAIVAAVSSTPRQTFANIGAVMALTPNQQDQQAVLDYLTTDSAARRMGRININTASQSVLETVPGITQDIAASIVQRQAQSGYASLGEVATVPGMSGSVLQQAADFLTASSQTFIVRVIGTSGQTSVALEALVDVQNGTPKILQIYDQPFNDMLTRWNWPTDTTSETVLKEAS